MITFDDCGIVCSSPAGIRSLCYCFADRYNKCEAFGAFCSLFSKGKSPSNPNPIYAAIAHRQMFCKIAGIEPNRDHTKLEEQTENLTLSYVDVSNHISRLDTIRPWSHFRADDVFTLIVLMDGSCNGYICFDDFASLIGIVLTAVRAYETASTHSVQLMQSCVHEAFVTAFDKVRTNSILNAENPINHSLEKHLIQFASTSRKSGLSPLSTLCNVGCRNQWKFNSTSLHNLLSKLIRNQSLTGTMPCMTGARMQSDLTELQVDESGRIGIDYEHNRWTSPNIKGSHTPTGSPAGGKRSPANGNKQANAAASPSSTSPRRTRANLPPQPQQQQQQQELNAMDVAAQLQTLQKAMADAAAAIASQSSDGVLSANTSVWENLVSLEKQLQMVKSEADSRVQIFENSSAPSPIARSVVHNNSSSSSTIAHSALLRNGSRSPSPSPIRHKQSSGNRPHIQSNNYVGNNNAAVSGDSPLAFAVNSSPIPITQRAKDIQNQQQQESTSPESVCSSISTSSTFGARILRSKSSTQLLGRSRSAEKLRPGISSEHVWKPSSSVNTLLEGNSLLSSIRGSPENNISGLANSFIQRRNDDLDTRFDADESIIGTVELMYQDQCIRNQLLNLSSQSVANNRSASNPKQQKASANRRPSASKRCSTSNNCHIPEVGGAGNQPLTTNDLNTSVTYSENAEEGNNVAKELFRSSANGIVEGKANYGGSGRPLMKSATAPKARPSSTGRFGASRPMNTPSASIASSSQGMVNMSIFKSSSTSHPPSGNINVFDPKTLKWKPTYLENKYNGRFQSTSDILLHSKLNAVFYDND